MKVAESLDGKRLRPDALLSAEIGTAISGVRPRHCLGGRLLQPGSVRCGGGSASDGGFPGRRILFKYRFHCFFFRRSSVDPPRTAGAPWRLYGLPRLPRISSRLTAAQADAMHAPRPDWSKCSLSPPPSTSLRKGRRLRYAVVIAFLHPVLILCPNISPKSTGSFHYIQTLKIRK